MTIHTDEELAALRRVGRLVAEVLRAMEAATRPGVTTAEIDEVAGRLFAERGARSAPRLVYGFPGETCISVNDGVVHGIPGSEPLRAGDVVKLDVTAELGGYMADAARTVVVGGPGGLGTRLASCAKAAFRRGLSRARAGRLVREIGGAVEAEVRRHGFAVIRELSGHGIGRTIHEAPTVPNFFSSRDRQPLEEGMVLTIEPLIAAGSAGVVMDPDGWTVRTRDRSAAAHYEHTLVVTRGRPILLTAA
jgi:methionyl aminopeptidase